MKKCLFLGYNSKKTSLISFMKKNNWSVKNQTKSLTYVEALKYDLIISFGYKKIIKKNLIRKLPNPIINLHISYLPFNRGSHPNFWSLIDETPSGVTIHEIISKLDAGPIIYQKKINLNPKKYSQNTFSKTYKILFKEVENLFKKKFIYLSSYNYKRKRQNNKGTFHFKKELPKDLKNWNINIIKYKNSYRKSN